MGRLPITDEWPADRTGHPARVQASQVQKNLAAVDGEVCTVGDMMGGQGRLQDRAVIWQR